MHSQPFPLCVIINMFQDQVRNYVTEPGTNFLHSTVHLKFCTGKIFQFFLINLLFIIFSNRDRINCIIIVFMFGRQIIFYEISPVISFFLEMVSCYFKILKFLVIVILIFNHPHLHSCCLILPLHQTKSDTHHCQSNIFAQCNQIT